MLLSELVERLSEELAVDGDCELDLPDYWCEGCNDWHDARGLDMERVAGKLKLSIRRIA